MAEMPTLKLYNTLTREKVAFAPIDPANVRMYVCGPTVYDFAHIGNARPAIVFDVLYRLLRHVYGEAHVKYVRNITDVDDKINARALRDYPGMELNAAIRLVTEKTDRQYQDDVKALGCLEPSVQPRATENIPQMVEIIQKLIDRGHAYVATGGEGREVLFATGSMADYGQLSKRKLEDQQAGARVAVEAHKKNPGDFVLWKESAADQPGWPADFSFEGTTAPIFGRPGWHIECSAMSGRYLGDVFDIHGGGLDLIFPHHENEIAQSRCAHGTDVMANVWMHNGFVQVEGRKMSKSDGNFVTIRELLDQWAGPVMRLVMLQTHYRQPMDWTVARLLTAREELSNWVSAVFDSQLLGLFETDVIMHKRRQLDSRVLLSLADDLNTSEAIGAIRAIYREAVAEATDEKAYDLLNALYTLGFVNLRKLGALLTAQFGSAPVIYFSKYRDLYLSTQGSSANSNLQKIEAANNIVAGDGLVFEIGESDGFVSLNKVVGFTGEDLVEKQITKRLDLLKSKNFAEADKIRDDLLSKGIQLKDGKDAATGERVTTWEVKR